MWDISHTVLEEGTTNIDPRCDSDNDEEIKLNWGFSIKHLNEYDNLWKAYD